MTLLLERPPLLDAFRRGERSALTEVYHYYSRHIFTMLSNGFSIVSAGKRVMFNGYREPWRLESAVQEVFLRAFSDNARQGYDGLRPYKNYLMTIARNLVVDAFRKDSNGFVLIDPLEDDRMSAISQERVESSSNPEKSATNKQLTEQVTLFVAGLNDDEKALFHARFVGGLSVESTATQLGVTEYWVKRNERNLKKRFFVFMRQRGYFDGFQYFNSSPMLLITLALLVGGRG